MSGPPHVDWEPADKSMKGRSRGEAACVAGLVFLYAGVAISCLVLGVLSVGGMVWEGVDEHHAWPSWPALALVLLVPPFGLFGTVLFTSGALAVGVVLAAASAALLRRMPFWVLLAITAPCLAASRIQIAWLVNLNRWGEPPSPGTLALAVLPPLFGSWLLLRRVLKPRTTPTPAPWPGGGRPQHGAATVSIGGKEHGP